MDNAFTGAALDRAGDSRRRDQAWLDEQRAHPAARAVVAGDRGLRIVGGHLELVPLAELNGAAAAPARPRRARAAVRGRRGSAARGPRADGRLRRRPRRAAARELRGDRLSLRQAAAILPQAEGGLVAYAAALLNWHRRHRFCSACGRESDIVEGGLTRLCPNCGAEHHPRTDPVVIMLVTDGDRLMLGRQASWPDGRYSALAGFVEPGEALEEAVAREVWEESGVRVGRPRYVDSQPWPFPASLMLGFSAPYESGEPRDPRRRTAGRALVRARRDRGRGAPTTTTRTTGERPATRAVRCVFRPRWRSRVA